MIFRTTLSALPLLLASFAGPTPAAAVEGWARLSGTLRAGPESDYPAITRVARGDALDVFGCLSGYDWCDVAVGGERGWFPGSRIELASDGRRVRMSRSVAGGIGLSILSFGMTDYWASHYEGRSFYRDDRYWRRHGMHPPQPGQARPDRPRSEPNHVQPQRPEPNHVRPPRPELNHVQPPRPEPNHVRPQRLDPNHVQPHPAAPAKLTPRPACSDPVKCH